jgi:hypothetical protein
MKWSLVVEIALLGLAIGVGIVYGLPEAEGWLAWIALRILAAVWIARAVRRSHFFHGFAAGYLGGAAAVLSGAVLYGTYTANHPEYLENAAKMPLKLDPRLILVVVALVVGLAHGIFQGALAFLAGKIVTSR